MKRLRTRLGILPKELKPVYEKAKDGNALSIIELKRNGYSWHAKRAINEAIKRNKFRELCEHADLLVEEGLLGPRHVTKAIKGPWYGAVIENIRILEDVGLLSDEHKRLLMDKWKRYKRKKNKD